MKRLLIIVSFLPALLYAQKDTASRRVNTPVMMKALNNVINPSTKMLIISGDGPNAYHTLPWLHRFLDTASSISIGRFLTETSDSILQLVHYESETARHAFVFDHPYSPSDKDGDGRSSYEYGGDDCDDLDSDTYPGHTERCDGYVIFDAFNKKYIIIYRYHDEDCDPTTIAGNFNNDVDADGDKQ